MLRLDGTSAFSEVFGQTGVDLRVSVGDRQKSWKSISQQLH